MLEKKTDYKNPRWDQGTYAGRVKHFFAITNPFNLLKSSRDLEESKKIVEYIMDGGDASLLSLSEDEIWRAKHLYQSAFHPDTKEKVFSLGRMCAQVPMNTIITGGLISFYSSKSALVFWQWVNQSFNAVVNYCNRSGGKPESMDAKTHESYLGPLMFSYAVATSGACITALYLNELTKRHKFAPIVSAFIPFLAVASANAINIPVMRSSELVNGISIYDESDNYLGKSSVAAKYSICMVLISRVGMCIPGMILPPILVSLACKRGLIPKNNIFAKPLISTALCCFCLVFMTPLCCALFPQHFSLPVHMLESKVKESIQPSISNAYFNKGL